MNENEKMLYLALKDLVIDLEAIGIPDWSGAEGLDLSKAKAAIAKMETGGSK